MLLLGVMVDCAGSAQPEARIATTKDTGISERIDTSKRRGRPKRAAKNSEVFELLAREKLRLIPGIL